MKGTQGLAKAGSQRAAEAVAKAKEALEAPWFEGGLKNTWYYTLVPPGPTIQDTGALKGLLFGYLGGYGY